MTPIRPFLLAFAGLALPLLPIRAMVSGAKPVEQSTPGAESAEAIMAKVAANQDASQTERNHYVYVQHARVTSRKGKTMMCEEISDIRVTPTAKGSHQQLLHLDGKVLDKHKYVTYNTLRPDQDNPETRAPEPPVEASHETVSITIGETDRSLVEGMRNGLTNQKDADAKDGISANLFPLTTRSQADDSFQFIGREQMNGRAVFHLTFRPKDKNDFGWKGDAYIDSIDYQPVVVSTTMNRNIPFAVRTLLGTSLPGLGFTVVYAPQPDGVWFPTSFSTEFKIKILFFLSRDITIDAKNRDFEKTHGEGKIVDSAEADPPITDSDRKPQDPPSQPQHPQ